MDLQKVIMKRFLRKLVNLNIWGERFRKDKNLYLNNRARSGVGRHTEIKNLQKSLPDHLRGTKEHKKALKELINIGFLNVKPSTGELHVSLNSHKQKEIFDFLQQE